jgi:5-methylcytosine-specific restriction protein A
MPRLRTLPPLVTPRNTNTVQLAPQYKDPFYQTVAYREWRRLVIARAGRQCEHVDGHGRRCTKIAPVCRLYAHHIVEVKDGGALLDPGNGRALCHQHHEQASALARSRRIRD